MLRGVPTEIRPFVPTDTDEILSLALRLTIGVADWRPASGVAAAAHGWLTSSLDSASEDHPVWVAEVDGRVVGVVTACARDHWSGERDAYVGELVVHEDHAGRGIGRALLSCAEDWARGRGFGRLRLETGEANRKARAFYARRGYVTEEVVLSKAL
jgi:GNAT superfamily N-acetyltransferase